MKVRPFDVGKRLGDIVGSLFLVILLLPFFVLLSAVLLVFQGPPLFFVQPRPGRGAKLFQLYKFRTMAPAESLEADASDLSRTTWLGRLLRLFSLDELPQLVNILLGQMSFVGPRPLLKEYLDLYTNRQSKRHFVRPGLTGLAQVSGRKELTWDHKIALDVYYVEHRSLKLDLWIYFRSVLVVLFERDGVEKEVKPMKLGGRGA